MVSYCMFAEKSFEPLLSVRLMVYNNSDFINDTMKGIMAQKTDFDVEVVVGDDFSTDDTVEKIKNFKNNEKIKIKILDRPIGGEYWLRRKESGTHLTNFVDILSNCTGKYIALLDGDDYWTDPYKLQKQVDFLEANEECSGVYTNFDYLKDTIVSQRKTPFTNKTAGEFFLIKDVWSGPFLVSQTATVVFRSKCVKDIYELFSLPNKLGLGGDNYIQCVLFNLGKVGYYNKCCSVYRLQAGGITTKLKYTKLREVKKLKFLLKCIFDSLLTEKTQYLLNEYVDLYVNNRIINVCKLLLYKDLSIGDILRWRLWVLKKTPII